MGLFGAAYGCGKGEGQKGPLPKIGHTNPTMIKLGTIIPYLEKIQKTYKVSLSSADISLFSPEFSKFCYIKKHRYRSPFNT